MEMLFKRMEANNVAFVILNSSNRWLGIALVRERERERRLYFYITFCSARISIGKFFLRFQFEAL